MIGLAIGNGTSRRGVDLSKLEYDVTIGCNGILDEFIPDYLVTLDTPVILKTVKRWKEKRDFHWIWCDFVSFSPVPGTTKVKFAWAIYMDGKRIIASNEINGGASNNSGIIAVWYLADQLGCDRIDMIGFDFFRPREPDGDGVRRNDIYTGTYSECETLAPAFEDLFSLYPDTRFVRVGPIEKNDEEFYRDNLKRLEHVETIEGLND